MTLGQVIEDCAVVGKCFELCVRKMRFCEGLIGPAGIDGVTLTPPMAISKRPALKSPVMDFHVVGTISSVTPSFLASACAIVTSAP
jgi:hypothetical protein